MANRLADISFSSNDSSDSDFETDEELQDYSNSEDDQNYELHVHDDPDTGYEDLDDGGITEALLAPDGTQFYYAAAEEARRHMRRLYLIFKLK